MSQLTRWGFDRAAGRQARPVPLVRRVVPAAIAVPDLLALMLAAPGAGTHKSIPPQGRAAAARSVHVRKVAGSSPAPATRSAGVASTASTVPPERVTDLPPATAPVVPLVPRPRAPRIDLALAPSGMERRFEGVPLERAPRPCAAEGMAYCRCHPDGLVPAWFGRDCIEPRCGLKGSIS